MQANDSTTTPEFEVVDGPAAPHFEVVDGPVAPAPRKRYELARKYQAQNNLPGVPRPVVPQELRGSPSSHLGQTSPHMPATIDLSAGIEERPRIDLSAGIEDGPSTPEPRKLAEQYQKANKLPLVPRPDSALNYAVPSPLPGGVGGFFPERTPKTPAKVAPYDWQRAVVGGATDIATGGHPGDMANPPLGEEMAKGVREMETPGKRGTGALRVAATGTEALTPLMGPAAIENPLSIARGMAEGTIASEAAGYGAKKAGFSPENVENVKSLAFWAPGVARSVIDPKLAIESSLEGTRASATVAGGRAGAGVAVTPEGVTVRGKVGPFEGSKTFSRGPAAGPAIQAPTIEGQIVPPAPPDPSATLIAEHDIVMQRAGRVAQGLPPLTPEETPPAPPLPPPISASPNAPASVRKGSLSPDDVAEVAQMIAKLPPDIRNQAMQEAHGTLTKVLMEQGASGKPVVLPSGQMTIIKDQASAEKVALQVMNTAISDHDKAQADAVKASLVAQPATNERVAAPRMTGRQRAAELARPKFEVVEAPQPRFEVVDRESTQVGPSLAAHASEQPQFEIVEATPPAAKISHESGIVGPSEPLAAAASEKAATESGSQKPFAKGDQVTFSRNLQVRKGEGKSEIIAAGTKAFIEHANPGMNFARVRLSDGKVHSVPLRNLEASTNEEPSASTGVSAHQPHAQPTAKEATAAGHGEAGAGGPPAVPHGEEAAPTKPEIKLPPELQAIRDSAKAEPRPGSIAADIGEWKPPAELGVFSAPDYGQKARSDVERRMGGPLPRGQGERRATEATAKVGEASEKKGPELLANAVYEKLKKGESLGNVTGLNALAEQHFGAARTSGTWTPKDAFDAMEAGVNKHLLDVGKELMSKPAHEGLKTLRELMTHLTSQGTRTDEQIKNQQFSTPPTESYIAAKAADIKTSDVVLEPSAGNGGLAVWPKAIGAETHVNEIAPRRREMLELAGFGKPTAHDGEIINSLLDPKIRPTVILMNPPFSASTQKSFAAKNDNKYGFNHVDSALQRLEPNGRLVAILGGGQANEPNGGASLTGGSSGKWFERIAEKYNVRANIRINGKEYQKYGTNFATRLIVIDKDGPTPSRMKPGAVKSWDSVVQKNVDTLEEAYNAIKDVAESRPEVAGEPGQAKLAEQGQPGTGVVADRSAGATGDRVQVRSSGETSAGSELSSGPNGPLGSAGRNQALEGNRGTAVRELAVQPGEHPETKSARSPASRLENAHSERPLSGTETSDAGLSLGRDKSLPVKEEEDSAAYVTYRPTLKGPAHPANIVETRTMATVPLPEITYKPSLPESVIKENKLSAVQLEAISIAGQQNDIVLPDGSRATALIGDGTGVGKGRIGAGVLLDNWNKGRKRLVWVSEKWDLMQDAIRDLQAIGAHDLAKTIKPFGKISANTPIDHIGVLFSTYALIRSEDKKGNSRINQLQQWLKGKDTADGAYILYDESHNLKNAVAANAQNVSQIGAAVKKMMLDTPNLRSVSLSATAATDVINLGYLDRLGLWGPGTPFPNGFGEFQSQIASGGMSAMEMVARELKAQGKYVSRTLSYKGVTYEEVEHVLTEEQKDLYRTASKAWASVVQQAEDTIKNTTNGGAQAKARFMSLFYGAQLRFFNVLLTTLKIPTAIEQATKALAADKSVVITLVNTNEAAQNREKNRDRGGEDSDEVPDYDFGPGEMLKDLVREHYPTQQFVDDVDSEGNPIKVPAYRTDADGRKVPLINPQAVTERDRLIAQLDRDLKMPANPLDILINGLGGTKKVAELTGRKERYDEASGKFVPRGDPNVKRDEINLSEMRAFQGGKKRVAILSSAAGTGISLHAGIDAANQQKRVHITLQPGWSADKAMQMMGRTHRSNEAHQPEYKMLTSDLGGEKRFTSTLAKRMGSLGALSKGQSNANAGADMMEKVNFESDQGRQATTSFYNALLRDVKIPGTNLTGMQVLTDLRVLKPAPGGGGMTVPPADRTNVTRLLNRLLALDPDVQNSVYNYFYDIFQATVQQAIEDGTLDTGVKTLPGDDFSVKEERAISKDPKTKAETLYYPVDAEVRTNRMSGKAMEKALKANAKKNAVLMRNKDGKLLLAMEASPIVHASGSVTPASYVVTPENGNAKKVPTNSLHQWKPADEWEVEKLGAQNAVERAQGEVDYAKRTAERYSGQAWADNRVGAGEQALKEAQAKLAEVEGMSKDPQQWARDQWEKQYREAPAHETKEHHLVGGAVLRWWNPIREATGQSLKIYTALDSKTGKRVVGVDIPADEIQGLLQRITGNASTVDASQLHTDVLKNGLSYTLEQGIQVKRGRVNREPVVQFIPSSQDIGNNLRRLGLIYERGVQPVYYLPNAEGRQEKERVEGILEKILKEYPVKQEAEKTEGVLAGARSGERGSSTLAASPVGLAVDAAVAVGHAAGRVKDFLAQEVADNRRAHDLQWDMYDLDKRHEARVLRAKELLQGLQKDGVTQEDRRAIDEHLDALEADSDHVPVPPLTPRQDEVLDKVLMPMKAEAEEAFKKVTGAGMTIPNYNPRQTKGRGGMLDRFLTPKAETRTGRGNLLSQTMPAENRRTMMALENSAGKRMVVSLKGGQVTAWDHGTPDNLGPIMNTEEGREFLDKDNNIWKLKQATKREIEEHTNVEYYHDAAASTVVNWLQAKKAEAAHDLVETWKNKPEFDQMAMKTDAGNPPKGWRTSNLPQLRGYYLEPHLAEVADWFNDRLKSGSPTAFDSINSYMRAMILLSPWKHDLNVGAQWAVNKGATGFLPHRWLKIGRTGARAIGAVIKQNQDFLDALDAGAPLQSARGATRDLVKVFYDQMAEGAEKGEPWATKLAKSVGLAPVELVKALHSLSSKIVWPVSDMMFLQAAYEYQADHPGVELHDALREVGRTIPEYRLPTRIMDSPTLAKVMSSNVATMFGAYHYGLLRSFTENAKSALGAGTPAPGRTRAEEVGKGWDRLALMALGVFGIYAVADQIARKLTGDKDAEAQRHGIFGLLKAAVDVAHKEATPTQALTKVMTPNPLTEGLVSIGFNRDLKSGRHLRDDAADWETQASQLMHYMLEEGMPLVSDLYRAHHQPEGWKKFAWGQGDVHFPKHGAEKLAQEIASSKMDTSAWTADERNRYYARQAALDGLRKGDGKAFDEGLSKGLIRPDEISSLIRRSVGSALYDKVHGFSYEETLRVYDKAVETKDEEAQQELLPLLLEKQSRLLSQGRYEEAGVQ